MTRTKDFANSSIILVRDDEIVSIRAARDGGGSTERVVDRHRRLAEREEGTARVSAVPRGAPRQVPQVWHAAFAWSAVLWPAWLR